MGVVAHHPGGRVADAAVARLKPRTLDSLCFDLLSPHERLAFWQAVNAPSKLTQAQKRLGAIIRGAK